MWICIYVHEKVASLLVYCSSDMLLAMAPRRPNSGRTPHAVLYIRNLTGSIVALCDSRHCLRFRLRSRVRDETSTSASVGHRCRSGATKTCPARAHSISGSVGGQWCLCIEVVSREPTRWHVVLHSICFAPRWSSPPSNRGNVYIDTSWYEFNAYFCETKTSFVTAFRSPHQCSRRWRNSPTLSRAVSSSTMASPCLVFTWECT